MHYNHSKKWKINKKAHLARNYSSPPLMNVHFINYPACSGGYFFRRKYHRGLPWELDNWYGALRAAPMRKSEERENALTNTLIPFATKLKVWGNKDAPSLSSCHTRSPLSVSIAWRKKAFVFSRHGWVHKLVEEHTFQFLKHSVSLVTLISIGAVSQLGSSFLFFICSCLGVRRLWVSGYFEDGTLFFLYIRGALQYLRRGSGARWRDVSSSLSKYRTRNKPVLLFFFLLPGVSDWNCRFLLHCGRTCFAIRRTRMECTEI